MKKRILALVLTLTMLLGVVAIFPVSAEDAAVEEEFVDVWDGTTSTEPAGSGTKSDPYLIASGANLKWLSDKMGNGGGKDVFTLSTNGETQKIYDFTDNSTGNNDFTLSSTREEIEVYCKQTNHIDLNNQFMRTIGAYTRGSVDNFTQYFGGHYDGQGYTIKNARFASSKYFEGQTTTVTNWSSGMFGVLYGATVENIVFDHVYAWGNQVAGIVAGRIIGSSSLDASESEQTVIRNITVKSNCTVQCIQTPAAGSSFGGIVGIASNATITNCFSSANLVFSDSVQNVGGVVGYMQEACYVDNCVFDGTISYNAAVNSQVKVGGVVGFWGPNNVKYCGVSGIVNCVNRGTFSGSVTTGTEKVFALGGVLGGCESPAKCTTGKTNYFVFENNYNFSGDDKLDTTQIDKYNTAVVDENGAIVSTGTVWLRFNGVAGFFWTSNSTAYQSITVKNCYSVPVTANRHDNSYVLGTVVGMMKKQKSITAATEVGCEVLTAAELEAKLAESGIKNEAEKNQVTTSGGWNGVESVKPEGSGTQADPYLIASAENLRWLSANSGGAGAATYNCVGLNGTRQTVSKYADDYVYCKQICDIDLNGQNFAAIGGYANLSGLDGNNGTSMSHTQYFYGEYDGQGYTIGNGNFVRAQFDTATNKNQNWPTGLFGVIWGATIKNIVFDNIVAKASQSTGIVAGIALAEYGNKVMPGRQNVISNIQVLDTCSVIANGRDAMNNKAASTVGGIVGRAENTLIEECVCNAQIVLNRVPHILGGVVGRMNNAVVVNRCVFGGLIDLRATFTYDEYIGGIAGTWTSCGPEWQGTSGITNCVNKGSFAVVANAAGKLILGGVLGGTGNEGISDDRDHLVAGIANYVFENNYNLSSNTEWNYSNYTGTCRAGAVIGGLWYPEGAAVLNIVNCHTVEFTGNNADTASYTTGVVTGMIRNRNVGKAKEINCSVLSADTTAEELDSLLSYILGEDVYGRMNSGYDGVAIAPEGTGTAADPYLIATPANLAWLGSHHATGAQRLATLGTNHTIYYAQYYDSADVATRKLITYAQALTDGKVQNTNEAADNYCPTESDFYASKGPFESLYETKFAAFDLPMVSADPDGEDKADVTYWNWTNVPAAERQQIYVEQVADIDLNGRDLDSIGGYWNYTNGSQHVKGQWFNGIYEGNDYTIMNGSSGRSNTNHYWINGLFGNVWGATIKNLTFDNFKVSSKGGAIGIVAGRVIGAQAFKNRTNASDVSGIPEWNSTIENIVVNDNCIVVANIASNTTEWNGVGGIVGNAGSATIQNCISNATIQFNKYAYFVGGVVGSMYDNVTVDKCVFGGTLEALNSDMLGESHWGGIVGDWRTYNTAYTESASKITNCVNQGSLRTSVAYNGDAFCVGGILGAGSNLSKDYTFVFENNYNLSTPAKWTEQNIDSDNKRVGGVVGCFYMANSTDYANVTISNCHTVPFVSVNDSELRYGTGYAVTGGIRLYTETVDEVITTYYAANEVGCTANAALAVDPAVMALTHGRDVKHGFIGVQVGKDEATGTYSLRFLSGIDSLDYDSLVYELGISAGGKTVRKTFTTRKVYSAFKITNVDGTTVTKTPQDYGYEYIAMLSLSGLSADEVYSFAITPKVITEEKVTLEGKTYIMEFDGSRPTEQVKFVSANVAHNDEILINGNSLSNYQIVYYKGHANYGSVIDDNGDDVAYAVATLLQDYILKATGVKLAVVVDGSAEENKTGYQIRVGFSDSGKTVDTAEYGIFVAGNALELLYSGSGYVAEQMLNAIRETYMNNRAYNVNLTTSGNEIQVQGTTLLSDAVTAPQVAYGGYAKDTGDIRVLFHNIHGYSIYSDVGLSDRDDLIANGGEYTAEEVAADNATVINSAYDFLESVYLGYDADIIGLQEVSENMEPIVVFLLNNGYDMSHNDTRYTAASYDASTMSTGGRPIFWKSDKFTFVEGGMTTGTNLSANKGTTWVILEENATGKTFAVTNSHFSANSESQYGYPIPEGKEELANAECTYKRNVQAQALVDLVTTGKLKNMGFIIHGGDYNTSYTRSAVYNSKEYCPFQTMIDGGLINVRDALDITQQVEWGVSGPGLKYEWDPEVVTDGRFVLEDNIKQTGLGSAIDHTLYNGTGATLKQYRVCYDHFSMTASDHAAHFVDFKLK